MTRFLVGLNVIPPSLVQRFPLRLKPLTMVLAGVLAGTCSCSELAGLENSQPTADQIRCQAGPDCDAKWRMATKWATETSGLKIEKTMDTLIQTATSPQGSRTL